MWMHMVRMYLRTTTLACPCPVTLEVSMEMLKDSCICPRPGVPKMVPGGAMAPTDNFSGAHTVFLKSGRGQAVLLPKKASD